MVTVNETVKKNIILVLALVDWKNAVFIKDQIRWDFPN